MFEANFFRYFFRNFGQKNGMAVKIRLIRKGTKNRPFYRLVASDSRRAASGENLEVLGTYDPHNFQVKKDSAQRQEKGILNLKTDRVTYWLDRGAEPSDTAASLLRRLKISKSTKAA